MSFPDSSKLLPTYEYFPSESDRLRLKLKDVYENIAINVNSKDIGIYSTTEQFNGQTYFPVVANPTDTRDVLRKVIDVGALQDGTVTPTRNIPHNISVTSNTIFTRIYGVATDPTAVESIPLPYVSATALANHIEIYVNATNVVITTGIDYSAYTTCYVVLEYILS